MLRSSKSAGLSIQLSKTGHFSYSLMRLEKKKGHIELTDPLEFDQLHLLTENLAKDIPLFVVIDGKGILHKKLQVDGKDTPAKLIHQCLPNAKPEEFYIQQSSIHDPYSWVSVARRNTVDDIVKELKELGYYLQDVTIGPFSVQTLTLLLENKPGNPLQMDENSLVVVHDKIEDIQKKQENQDADRIPMDGRDLFGNQLKATGMAFQHFLPDASIQRFEQQQVSADREEFFHKKLFRFMGRTALTGFLMTVLLNFLFFDHYNKKYEALSDDFYKDQERMAELEALKNEVAEKQLFMERSGVSNASNISYFADQLAASLPHSILLKELNINPLQQKKGVDNTDLFNYNQIRITGITRESLQLNEWIKKIKKHDWAGEVMIIDYSRLHKNKGNAFELLIQLKETSV